MRLSNPVLLTPTATARIPRMKMTASFMKALAISLGGRILKANMRTATSATVPPMGNLSVPHRRTATNKMASMIMARRATSSLESRRPAVSADPPVSCEAWKVSGFLL